MGINKITSEMQGLKFHIIDVRRHQEEDNEYDVEIRIEKLSDEGLEMFGLNEDDID